MKIEIRGEIKRPLYDGSRNARSARASSLLLCIALLLIIAAGAGTWLARRGRVPSTAAGITNAAAARTHFENGTRLIQSGNRAEAMRAWETAIGLDPGFTPPYFAMANANASAGDIPAAIQRLEVLRHTVANAQHVECREADIYLRANLLTKALQMARAAVGDEKACPKAHMVLGGVLAADGDYVGAVRELAEARKLEPDSEGVSLTMAQALAKAGRPDEGIRLADEVLTRSPKNMAQAQYVMGRLLSEYGRGGRRDDITAGTYLQSAVVASPSNLQATSKLGVVLVRLNQFGSAKKALEKAIALGVYDADTAAAFARVSRHFGDARAADVAARDASQIAAREKSLRASRLAHLRFPSAKTSLALARLEAGAGNAPEALDLVKSVLKDDPNQPEALEMLQHVTPRNRTRAADASVASAGTP